MHTRTNRSTYMTAYDDEIACYSLYVFLYIYIYIFIFICMYALVFSKTLERVLEPSRSTPGDSSEVGTSRWASRADVMQALGHQDSRPVLYVGLFFVCLRCSFF